MIAILGPFIAKGTEDLKEAFKVVFLFTAHHVN
jgi:hypothetical protein